MCCRLGLCEPEHYTAELHASKQQLGRPAVRSTPPGRGGGRSAPHLRFLSTTSVDDLDDFLLFWIDQDDLVTDRQHLVIAELRVGAGELLRHSLQRQAVCVQRS